MATQDRTGNESQVQSTQNHSAERPLRDRLTVAETESGKVCIDWAERDYVTTRLLSASDARLMAEWLIESAAKAERLQAAAHN